MISDAKRREVARELRETVGARCYGRPGAIGSCVDVDDLLTALLGRRVYGCKEAIDSVEALHLADLIDRPKAKREGVGNYWLCRHCGAFNRKDAITDCFGVIPSRGCGNCGREWEK